MASADTFKSVKKATVAIALMEPSGKLPFQIVGSGFCIDSSGVIATCEHVISAFMSESIPDQMAGSPDDGNLHIIPNRLQRRPFALFYFPGDVPTRLFIAQCPIDLIVARNDYDLGLVRAAPHEQFKAGFPTVQIADYADVHEGLEVGTYGFPLSNFLFDQMGTATSSLTRGTLSSVIPTAYVTEQHVRAFQLDLTATHGNSGGPVFSADSGKVFGVLQGGVITRDGSMIALARAEPIYPIISGGEIDLLRNAAPGGVMPSEQAIRASLKPSKSPRRRENEV